ncbi:DUF7507 domain-containing protein [Flavobacterium sp. WC2509]|uniref:DUF7507 domain-containing protein n=1 Tax=Flavobacterium sp. WC2509 TaxID=3461406 RepID=UPI004044B853
MKKNYVSFSINLIDKFPLLFRLFESTFRKIGYFLIFVLSYLSVSAQCNSVEPIPMVPGSFDDLSVSTSTTGCLLCGVTGSGNVIDSNLSNFATAVTTIGLGVTHSIKVVDGNDTYAAGSFVGYRIKPSGGVLSVNLLNGISIKTYLGGVLKETTTGGSLVSLNLLSNPGDYIVGFNTTEVFDSVEISINSLAGLVTSTNIYYPVITTYCPGPNLSCNVPTAMNYPLFPTIIETSHTGIFGLGAGSVTNTNNVLTADTNDFASISVLVGVASSGSISVKNQATNYPSGTYAGFEISNSNLVDISALGNVTIRTYLKGAFKEQFSGNNLLVNGNLLNNNDRYKVGFVSTMNFDEVQISINQVAGINLGSTKVYNAVFENFCAGPTLPCNTPTTMTAPTYPVFINGVNTGISGLTCALCSITNVDNLIDTNLTNYALVSLTASVGSSGSISVKDQITDYPAGNFAGFDIESSGLLSVDALNAITVTTYLNGTVKEIKSGTGALVSVGTDLLVSTGRKTIGFTTTTAFDEVKISFNNTGAVTLGDTKVYGALFQKFCVPTVLCNQTYALTNPDFPVFIDSDRSGVSGVVCAACTVNNSNNVLTASTTDFANITLDVGVLATGSIAVKDQLFTYPTGTFAGFTIRDLNNLVELNLFQSLTISTYNNGVLQQSRTGGQLLGLSLVVPVLGSGPGFHNVGFKATLPFDEIRITVNSLASVITNINVYGAFVNTKDSNSGGSGSLNCASSDLGVVKTVSNNAPVVGSNVIFTITASNAGPSDATGVVVNDVLPTGYSYVSSTVSTGAYDSATGVWTIGNMTVNVNQTLTITAIVKDAGNYANTATITGTESDFNMINNTSTVTPVPVNAIVANDDTGGLIYATVGGIAVTNVLTNDTLNGQPVTISQVNLTFISSTDPNITLSGTDVIVAPGITAGNYALVYQICEKLHPTNCDQATVTINIIDPNVPSIRITKDGLYVDNNSDGITSVGDTVVYSFVVTNTGNVTLSNITVTDNNATVSGGPLATLAVGASDASTFTAIHTITQADIDAKLVYNLATINATDPSNNPVTATSTDPTPCTTCPINTTCPTCTTTTLTTSPGIKITKDGLYVDNNSDGITSVGDTVVYSFVVTNTGNVTLSNITVTDNNATVSGGPLATLAVGASDASTFTAIHTITQADIDAKLVYNLATINATDPSNNPVTATSTDPTPCTTCPINTTCPTCTTTTLTTSPGIKITKDGLYVDNNSDGITSVGDTVVYSFVVTNTGNVTLSNITVTDNNATVSGGPLATLAVGASDANTFTAIHTITQADIDAKLVYNLATINATDPSNNPVTATSTDPTPCTTCPTNTTCPTCTTTTLTTSPGIKITKDGLYVDNNSDGITSVGDTVVYSFVVTNTGNVTLSNITVTDNNATVSGGPLATLAVGASDANTFTAIHTITQADIDAKLVYNLATINATDPSNNPVTATSTDPTPCTTCPTNTTCPTCTTTTLTTSPGIKITKDGLYVDNNSDGITSVGDTVVYSFVVTNTGNVTLSNITVTDNNATVSGGPLATLAVGASDASTFTAIHTITQADIDAKLVYNLATINATDPSNNPVTATSTDPTPCTTCPTNTACPTCTTTTLTTSPGIKITKDGLYVDNNSDGITSVGDTVMYSFVVTNTGNVTLSNITVTDNNATVSGGPLATLAVGASNASTFTAIHTITQADIDAKLVYNLATINATDPSNNPVTATSTDPTPCTTCPTNTTCPTCTTTTLTTSPGIKITKDGLYVDNNSDGITSVGDTVVYSFVVTNTGNVTLRNITVTDNNATVSGGPLATLAVGASDASTFTAIHTITQADIDAKLVYNLATITATDPSNNPVTATSTDPTPCTTCPTNTACPTCTTTTLTTSPGIKITKDGLYVDNNSDGITSVGDTVVYSFVVTNTGNVTLSNITVTDNNATVSGGPLATLAVGASNASTFTAIHTITQADIDAKLVYNLATINATDPSNNPVTATSTDPTPCTTCPTNTTCPTCTTTTLTTSPSIKITKDGLYVDNNSDGITSVGDTVVYSFVVTNTGNVTLSNITVTDNNATVSGGPLATLAVGASNASTFTAIHTITQADIDAKLVYNLATITATDPSNNPVTATSTDPTPCTTCPTNTTCPTCTTTLILKAKDDPYSIVACGSASLVGNIFTNDALGIIFVNTSIDSHVDLTILTGSYPNINIDNNGDIKVTGTLSKGVYTFTYRICSSALNICDVAKVTINVTDTTNPVWTSSLPNNITVNCTNIPVAPILAGSDSCGSTTVTYNEIITAGSCPGNYVITRTWVLMDSSNNSITHTQTITVQDTSAPTFVEALPANVTVECSNIPVAVILTAIDNCSSANVSFTQTISDKDSKGTYTISRTWRASDLCNNSNVYTQIVKVTTPNYSETLTLDQQCNSDSSLSLDLINLIKSKYPDIIVPTGTWTVMSGASSAFNATTGIFTPFGLQIGDYVVKYNNNDLNCPKAVEITIPVVLNCVVLPCASINIYNGISANNDGQNDFFFIENITEPCYTSNTVEVYNRWGIKVFERTNYDNITGVFNGVSEGRDTINQSSELPSGTYYYVLKIKSDGGNDIVKNGYLYLTR